MTDINKARREVYRRIKEWLDARAWQWVDCLMSSENAIDALYGQPESEAAEMLRALDRKSVKRLYDLVYRDAVVIWHHRVDDDLDRYFTYWAQTLGAKVPYCI